MNANDRNALISCVLYRINFKGMELDEALRSYIQAHEIEVTERQYFLIRASVKRASKGDWGKKAKQLEWNWGKSPRQDDQLSGARG